MIANRRRQIQDLVVTLQQAFLEAPALRLTLSDAERQCGADAPTCEAVLNFLVDAGVLAGHRNGSMPAVSHSRPVARQPDALAEAARWPSHGFPLSPCSGRRICPRPVPSVTTGLHTPTVGRPAGCK